MTLVAPNLVVRLRSVDYDRPTRRFTVEVSQLARPGVPFLHHLHADGGALGLHARSPFTGHVVAFALHRELRDRENELLAWVLRPIPEHVTLHRLDPELEIHVVND